MQLFEIKNRWTGNVIISVEIQCEANAIEGLRLGLAVRAAITGSADLSCANLRGADLRDADLSSVNLSCANLRSANLRGANLRYASLSGANLRSANLRYASLRDANLRDANLRSADLSSADLSSADLSSADLSSADLSSADLSSANLRGAKGADFAIAKTRILADGDIIGWKQCLGDVVVKLRIPADARRSHAFGRKCRAEFADVLEVIGGDVGVSIYDRETEYHVGQRVRCDEWCEDWMKECAGGIHFYITRLEAINQ